MGAQLTPKMTSDDDSPKQWCDRHVKLYTHIHFIGPLDLLLKASRVYYCNGGIYDNTMSILTCSTTHFKLVPCIYNVWCARTIFTLLSRATEIRAHKIMILQGNSTREKSVDICCLAASVSLSGQVTTRPSSFSCLVTRQVVTAHSVFGRVCSSHWVYASIYAFLYNFMWENGEWCNFFPKKIIWDMILSDWTRHHNLNLKVCGKIQASGVLVRRSK